MATVEDKSLVTAEETRSMAGVADITRRIAPVFFMAALIAAPAPAAEWRSSFGVAPRLTWTDNVCLEGDNKKSEWIYSVAPRLGFTGRGARANVAFNGALQFNSLDNNNTQCADNQNNNDRQSPIPSLNASAQTELIRNWFYLDANANARQNPVNAFAASGDDGLNRSGNVNTTVQYGISPSIRRRFKNYANLNVGYTYNDQYNSEDIVGDSVRERADASLSSLGYFFPFGWTLSGYWDKVDYDRTNDNGFGDGNSTLRGATLTLTYQVLNSLQLNGSIGEEFNDFNSREDDIDGTTWNVGFFYTPNSRTSLSGGYGERFFGKTPRVEFSHRRKRSLFTLQYVKDITFSRSLRGQGAQIIEGDGDGGFNVGEDPSGLGTPTTLSRSAIVNERFTVGYSLRGRRTTLSLSGNRSEQETADFASDSIFTNASLSLNRNLGRTMSATARVSWNKNENDDDLQEFPSGDSETWVGSLGLTRRFGQGASMQVSYQYTDRNSDLGNDEFVENRITFTINTTF